MKQLGLYPVKHETLSISEKIHIIAETGFDFIAASNIKQLTDTAPDGFLASAEREGLPIDNVHLSGSGTSKIWYEGSEGDEIVERYKKEMEIAVAAGVPLGVIHVTWGTKMPPFNQLGMDRLARIVEHAEKVGFTIGFENSVSLEHFEAALDTFKSPNVTFTFDSGHWNEFCADSEIYDKYNSLMMVTHIDDNDGIRDLHIIPFDGCTDFAKIAHSYKRMDRLTFEVSGKLIKEYDLTAEEIRESMKRVNIINDESLVRIYDGGIAFYENLSYAEYIERLFISAKKLRDMIEAAE